VFLENGKDYLKGFGSGIQWRRRSRHAGINVRKLYHWDIISRSELRQGWHYYECCGL